MFLLTTNRLNVPFHLSSAPALLPARPKAISHSPQGSAKRTAIKMADRVVVVQAPGSVECGLGGCILARKKSQQTSRSRYRNAATIAWSPGHVAHLFSVTIWTLITFAALSWWQTRRSRTKQVWSCHSVLGQPAQEEIKPAATSDGVSTAIRDADERMAFTVLVGQPAEEICKAATGLKVWRRALVWGRFPDFQDGGPTGLDVGATWPSEPLYSKCIEVCALVAHFRIPSRLCVHSSCVLQVDVAVDHRGSLSLVVV